MSSHLRAELAATCSTLGHLHKGNYLIEPECLQSVKDLIHYLKRDNDLHDIRRYLGESKILQNDLIQIIKNCPKEDSDLFDATLRLLINLMTPALLFYGEDVPAEKTERKVYLSLVGYSQDYKVAFCDVEFWNKICSKLTDLFEIDWADRSADDGLQIERILMLLRNVLQVPADVENEKRPENDITVHDKILWTLRQSQILEFLLFVSSNKNEEQYFLNLLEIFSIVLREQNPKLLANCDIQRSLEEKNKDTEDLLKMREAENRNRNRHLNMRNFNVTFVMKGVKSLSNRDIVCHKSLNKVGELNLLNLEKKQIRARRSHIPVESDRAERRSTFFVRLFLREFCLEFLNCSFKHLMNVVKKKLDSGKTLANDQTYYFWALNFFLDFATATNSDVDLIKDLLSSESFHFVQTNIDNAFEHLIADKSKTVNWVKRIHLILKAYRSLLETLLWMDFSHSALTRSFSRAVKCQIFYFVEYREMTLHLLLRYDPTKFSLSYLRDLIETIHLFIKLLEDYSNQVKLVVQRTAKKKSMKKKSKKTQANESLEEKWEKLKDNIYDTLCSESAFPEIPPFDAALEIPIDDQKGRAMKGVQGFLHRGKIENGIGLLRSARLVWPENDYFGFEGMSPEDEMMALKEIFLADLQQVEWGNAKKIIQQPQEEEDERENSNEEDDDCSSHVVEHEFDIMEYKKRLVNRRVIEGCGILLRNYKNNSDHTNHCVIKLLHRIGWECCMPAMLFQASIFWTLLKILQDNRRNYNEIHTFTVNLLRKFRKYATKNPVVFLELLFWKDHSGALEIQHGYEPYTARSKTVACSKKRKSEGKFNRDGKDRIKKNQRKENNANFLEENVSATNVYERNEDIENNTQAVKKKRKGKKRKEKEQTKKFLESTRNVIPVNLNSRIEDRIVDRRIDRIEFSTANENPCTLGVDHAENRATSFDRKNVGVADKNEEDKGEIQNGHVEMIETKISQDSVKDTENSEDEENSGITNCHRTRHRGNYRIMKTSKDVVTECEGSENFKSASDESDFTYDSGSEEETMRKNSTLPKNYHDIVETVREDSDQEKVQDIGGVCQTSSSFEKLRRKLKSGERRALWEDSDESSSSGYKRFRFIDLDSDIEGEAVFPMKIKKRKRLAVIDSDSDAG